MSIGKPLKFLGRQLLLGTALTVTVIAAGHLVSWLIGWVTVR
jgi:hypothetical protein